jgi:hypothetical protein
VEESMRPIRAPSHEGMARYRRDLLWDSVRFHCPHVALGSRALRLPPSAPVVGMDCKEGHRHRGTEEAAVINGGYCRAGIIFGQENCGFLDG